MRQEPVFIRKGASIRQESNGNVDDYRSINAAKRESRKIQMDLDGALGRGSVKVVEKRFPKRRERTDG